LFFTVFLVGTFQLIRQQYNVVTNGVSVGNIQKQTSKGSGMDSWTECGEEIVLRVHKGQGRLPYCVLQEVWVRLAMASTFCGPVF